VNALKIIFVHSLMFNHRTWQSVAGRLETDGIELIFVQQQQPEKALAMLCEGSVDIFIGELSSGFPFCKELGAAARNAAHRLELSREMKQDFSTFSEKVNNQFRCYIEKVSEKNFYNGIKYLVAATGKKTDYSSIEPVKTCGLYHPEATDYFDDAAAYIKWRRESFSDNRKRNIIGILCYYSQIMEKDCAEIDSLIHALEDTGLLSICAFCEGIYGSHLSLENRMPWLRFFQNDGARADLLLSLLGGRFLSRSEDIAVLKKLDIPIFQLIKNHHQTPGEWLADPEGINPVSMVYSLAQPETAGLIEPSLIACTKTSDSKQNRFRQFVPVADRLKALCSRVKRWRRLRQLPNAEKKITVILHNNPCKGVEATVGMAVGLDVFASLARLLLSMGQAGYDIGSAGEIIKEKGGQGILDLLFERKAMSEFRWTTVDEIVKKGGVLYFMGKQEYEDYFLFLPDRVKGQLKDDWGLFPGQGMVYEKNGKQFLIITGLEFGNIKIMLQPKRGCYGAKCNGEVCRILHDPELSPPHHWLATYKYIRDTSDAVIHFGTEGALEFLPGKKAALSRECFPEVSIGDLPNFYPYIMDVPGEGLVAKRRGRAVIIDHLTPVYSPAELDKEILQLQTLLEEYLKAFDLNETGRLSKITAGMKPLMEKLEFIPKGETIEDFHTQAQQIARQIELSRRSLSREGMHVFGVSPDTKETARMIASIWWNKKTELPDPEKIEGNGFEDAVNLVGLILADNFDNQPEAAALSVKDRDFLKAWCLEAASNIKKSNLEINQLLHAMDGGYIEPGLGGSLTLGKMETLPTGRNFFSQDVTQLPTKEAWEVGKILADKLINKFLQEEQQFPERVGVSLWSTDAFKSDGEVFSQILWLLGVEPRRNQRGRINGLKAVGLDKLLLNTPEGKKIPRPRVDVTIQTSGILRDMVPHFCRWIDEAVVVVSRLDEPEEKNFILKHTREQMAELQEELDGQLTESALFRMASFRVFSSAPGTYGLGVGLALDASAWQDDKDLAEAYVNWGGHAYGGPEKQGGEAVNGKKAHQFLAAQLAQLDISYMKQSSPEYDLLDCGGYAVFHGGMAAAARGVGGKEPKIYWGDSNRIDDLDVRDIKDDIDRAAHAGLLNTRWIDKMKGHGFQGAQEVSSKVNNLFKWSATSRQVDKMLFDKVAKTYILNSKNLKWLQETNPYALEEITRRMLEAESRGLWKADPELLNEVRDAALLVEGDMEESMGDVTDEFQGNKVEVLTSDDVENWNYKWRL
jgi:cobaltochelatase CobN